ncbi:hypothetical protein AGMMS49546_36130 [Spirochaetia bacterium]|nr:hypothetical protein AGMMS49546_36130 [Spirochaetia bacterium]
MKSKYTIVTGTAILSLFIITFFAGCFTTGGSTGGGSTAPAAPKVNYVPDGTYTFYPRLRAHQGGVDKNVYLDRIEAKAGNVTIYLGDRPLGRGDSPDGQWHGRSRNVILQDLDRPERSYNVTNAGEDGYNGPHYLTFEKVTGTRFSLINNGYDTPYVFDEITISEPDVSLGLPPLKNGTYTFYPRLRAMQGGADQNVYLDRIVIRGGNFTLYLVDKPVGKGNNPEGQWSGRSRRVILQDLDHPQLVYNVTNAGEDGYNGPHYLTFQNVTATRFSLTNYGYDTPYIFDEITLGEPDAQ